MKAGKITALVVALLMVNAMVARPAHAGSRGLPYALSIPVILAGLLLLALIADGNDNTDVREKPRRSRFDEEDGALTRVARRLPCGAGNGETIPLACW